MPLESVEPPETNAFGGEGAQSTLFSDILAQPSAAAAAETPGAPPLPGAPDASPAGGPPPPPATMSETFGHFADASPEETARGGMSGPPTSMPFQSELEEAFGTKLGHIPVHADEKAADGAAALGANAYAFDGGIALGAGKDKGTVAEEVAHTLQAGKGGTGGGVTDPTSPAETEADNAAKAAAASKAVGPLKEALTPATIARSTNPTPSTPPPAPAPGAPAPANANAASDKAKADFDAAYSAAMGRKNAADEAGLSALQAAVNAAISKGQGITEAASKVKELQNLAIIIPGASTALRGAKAAIAELEAIRDVADSAKVATQGNVIGAAIAPLSKDFPAAGAALNAAVARLKGKMDNLIALGKGVDTALVGITTYTKPLAANANPNEITPVKRKRDELLKLQGLLGGAGLTSAKLTPALAQVQTVITLFEASAGAKEKDLQDKADKTEVDPKEVDKIKGDRGKEAQEAVGAWTDIGQSTKPAMEAAIGAEKAKAEKAAADKKEQDDINGMPEGTEEQKLAKLAKQTDLQVRLETEKVQKAAAELIGNLADIGGIIRVIPVLSAPLKIPAALAKGVSAGIKMKIDTNSMWRGAIAGCHSFVFSLLNSALTGEITAALDLINKARKVPSAAITGKSYDDLKSALAARTGPKVQAEIDKVYNEMVAKEVARLEAEEKKVRIGDTGAPPAEAPPPSSGRTAAAEAEAQAEEEAAAADPQRQRR